MADVELAELKGFPDDLVETLKAAGYKSLRDILDLERSDVATIEGMSTESVDVLLEFLSEVTEENTSAEGEDAVAAESPSANAETEDGPSAEGENAGTAESPANDAAVDIATETETDAEETAETPVAESEEPKPTPTA